MVPLMVFGAAVQLVIYLGWDPQSVGALAAVALTALVCGGLARLKTPSALFSGRMVDRLQARISKDASSGEQARRLAREELVIASQPVDLRSR